MCGQINPQSLESELNIYPLRTYRWEGVSACVDSASSLLQDASLVLDSAAKCTHEGIKLIETGDEV
jgi:hypothetical protein